MTRRREPVSAVTAAAYVPAGGVLYLLRGSPETAVMAAALTLLAAGTFAFHWWPKRWAQDLDHGGMNAAYLALVTAAAGGPWWAMIAAALSGVGIEYVLDHPNRVLMVVTVGVTVVAGYSSGALAATSTGLGLMGAGLAIWQIREPTVVLGTVVRPDWTHGAWHVLTAAGTTFLYLAAV